VPANPRCLSSWECSTGHGRANILFLEQPVLQYSSVKQAQRAAQANIGFVFQASPERQSYRVRKPEISTVLTGTSRTKSASAGLRTSGSFQHCRTTKDLFPKFTIGGQQQLVGVARAVIPGPKLFLDEEHAGNLHSAQGERAEIMRPFHETGTRGGQQSIQGTASEKNATYGKSISSSGGRAGSSSRPKRSMPAVV